MIRSVTVGCASGLHARAAARVAAVAAAVSPVSVRRDGGHPVPADSILSLLTLAATAGTSLILESDDQHALAAVAEALSHG